MKPYPTLIAPTLCFQTLSIRSFIFLEEWSVQPWYQKIDLLSAASQFTSQRQHSLFFFLLNSRKSQLIITQQVKGRFNNRQISPGRAIFMQISISNMDIIIVHDESMAPVPVSSVAVPRLLQPNFLWLKTPFLFNYDGFDHPRVYYEYLSV